MAEFKIAFKKTGGFEGGYSNHPADSGGETWAGVARKYHPNWAGWAIVDKHKKALGVPADLYTNAAKKSSIKTWHNKIAASLKTDHGLEVLVESFYKTVFWDPIHGDNIVNQETANEIYDTAVNGGVGTAIKLAERSADLAETGKMSDTLLNSLNNIA